MLYQFLLFESINIGHCSPNKDSKFFSRLSHNLEVAARHTISALAKFTNANRFGVQSVCRGTNADVIEPYASNNARSAPSESAHRSNVSRTRS